MGRGLSELQKTILVMARENRTAYELGPCELRVMYFHPGLSFQKPDGCESLAHSPRYWQWWNSRHDPRCLEQWRESTKAMEELVTKIHGADFFPEPDPTKIHRPTKEEEASVMALVESLDDLDIFESDNKMPIWFSMESYGSRPYYKPAEAEWVVEQLKARGFEARVKYMELHHADVYAWEVMGKVYGFDRHRKTLRGGPQGTHWSALAGKRAHHRTPGGKFYDVQAIGAKRYNAAKVAASKAFKRLEERGLAIRFSWRTTTGIKLTEQGITMADQLMANRFDHVKTVSH
jgi:hypothetical protein